MNLEFFENKIMCSGEYLMGYPVSPYHNDTHHSDIIEKFSKYLLVNAGNPENDSSNSQHHTKWFEKSVVDFFSELFEIKNSWGYITSGSSEGNFEGLIIGKKNLIHLYNKNPIFLTSKSSHYSLYKSVTILDLNSYFLEVDEHDEIDLVLFRKFIESLSADVPILLNVNIGTTMKGGCDNHKELVNILKEKNRKYYIHADMALYGMIYRLFHDYDKFFHENISSFTISGHKIFSIPHPCAIFISKKELVRKAFISETIEYINSSDNTLLGTRNGISSMLFWSSIKDGVDPIKKVIEQCLENTRYLENKLRSANVLFNSKDNGIIVYFKQPIQSVCKKYQLACHNGISHVVCMPHVTRKLIDMFVNDLIENSDFSLISLSDSQDLLKTG